MKYKRVVVTRYGGPEVLQVLEDELPEPQSREVRVKILATGVSFADIMIRKGVYPKVKPPVPFTPGYDFVGVVDKLGEGVSSLAEGQLVAALTIVGSYAEFICLPATELVPMLSGLDPAEAVALVLNYVTAHQMMHCTAKVKSDGGILIHGAAGGVGTALLQLGRLANLEMYGTASKLKHDLVSELGGTPIDYKSEDFVERVWELAGDGMDAVFDPISAPNWRRSYSTLRKGGCSRLRRLFRRCRRRQLAPDNARVRLACPVGYHA